MQAIEADGGVLRGAPLEARNGSAGERGSIHDDATAKPLGFRGGTVAGSVHMDQFVPVLVRAFGQRWLEDGSLSLYFQNATVDREAVRACADDPGGDAGPVRVWMERDDGLPVAEGTAGVGDISKSALRTRDLRPCDPSSLRMLKPFAPAQTLGPFAVEVNAALQRRRLADAVLSAPLDWYETSSPWGDPIAAPSTLVDLLWRAPSAELARDCGGAVGLFGAIEVAHLAGPVRLGAALDVTATVVALTESPKTEGVWFDSVARERDGTPVAGMRMLLRFMKASSAHYA